MNLSQLSAKQKRIVNLRKLLTDHGVDSNLKAIGTAIVNEFTVILARSSDSGSVSSADADSILDIERRLEQLSEDARLETL